jgi:hypothetical protein
MDVAVLVQTLQQNDTHTNPFNTGYAVAAGITLCGVIASLIWNAFSSFRLARLQKDLKTSGYVDELRSAARQKIKDDATEKAQAVGNSGYHLLENLETLAVQNADLSDAEVLTKIDTVLEQFATYKASAAVLAPMAGKPERDTLKSLERLAVEVILDVARRKASRQNREAEMQVHAKAIKTHQDLLNGLVLGFTPLSLQTRETDVAAQPAAK